MEQPRRILIAPWLELREARTVGRITLLPRALAIERSGDVCEHVDARTSVFIDNDAIGGYLHHGYPIKPVNSAIAFLDDGDPAEARRAVDALCVATIAANEPPISYANGTTFFNLVQSLGGEPRFIGDRRPRLHGSVHDGYSVDYSHDVRPRNAEHFHSDANEAFLAALVAGSEREQNIADALAVIRMAASDSPDLDVTLALTLYAATTVRILAQPGLDDGFDKALARVKSLLQEILGAETTGDRFGYHIARAWKAVRDDRNDWWHPNARKAAASRSSGRPSSGRTLSRFAWCRRSLRSVW